MTNKNKEGYTDLTASKAIKKADAYPEKVTKTISLLKCIADWSGFEITNRIWLKDKDSGREYR